MAYVPPDLTLAGADDFGLEANAQRILPNAANVPAETAAEYHFGPPPWPTQTHHIAHRDALRTSGVDDGAGCWALHRLFDPTQPDRHHISDPGTGFVLGEPTRNYVWRLTRMQRGDVANTPAGETPYIYASVPYGLITEAVSGSSNINWSIGSMGSNIGVGTSSELRNHPELVFHYGSAGTVISDTPWLTPSGAPPTGPTQPSSFVVTFPPFATTFPGAAAAGRIGVFWRLDLTFIVTHQSRADVIASDFPADEGFPWSVTVVNVVVDSGGTVHPGSIGPSPTDDKAIAGICSVSGSSSGPGYLPLDASGDAGARFEFRLTTYISQFATTDIFGYPGGRQGFKAVLRHKNLNDQGTGLVYTDHVGDSPNKLGYNTSPQESVLLNGFLLTPVGVIPQTIPPPPPP